MQQNTRKGGLIGQGKASRMSNRILTTLSLFVGVALTSEMGQIGMEVMGGLIGNG